MLLSMIAYMLSSAVLPTGGMSSNITVHSAANSSKLRLLICWTVMTCSCPGSVIWTPRPSSFVLVSSQTSCLSVG